MIGNTSRVGSWLNFAQRSRDEGGLGLAPHQAAGVVGNLVHESGQDLNPWGPSGDNGTAWGTAQWRNERLDGLKNYAAANGLDYRTVEAQQGFMRHELDTSEGRAFSALSNAKTPEEAATAFNTLYERSADRTGNRERAARGLMAQFGDDTSPGALTSAFAPTESKTSMPSPALSADEVTGGPGALSAATAAPGQDRIADALSGIGASLAGIANPDQAKAITAQMVANRKQAADAGTWSMHVLPNGQIMRINSKTGMPQILPGTYSKPEEDTYVSEAKKASAKVNQEYGDSIAQSAASAVGTQADLDELKKLYANPNVYQGAYGDTVQTARKLFSNFGFGDSKAIADADVAKALSNKLALQLVQNGGDKLLPGSFSDSDRKFVAQMAASLDNSPEANQRLLDIYSRVQARAQEAEAVRQKHLADNNGVYMPSFRKEIADLNSKWAADNKAREEAAAKTAPAAAQPASKPTKAFKTKNGVNWSY